MVPFKIVLAHSTMVLKIYACVGSSYSYIYSKYLSMVRREPMRLLEIGMGCSVHGGVKGLNTLAVRRASSSLSGHQQLQNFSCGHALPFSIATQVLVCRQ